MRYAQRLHIIRSLDTLVYQLIAVSFFISPSFFSFAVRIFFQFIYTRPRELDSNRSLRFWYILNFFFNFGSIWSHAWQGAAQGRAIVIDFVGQTGTPTRLRLLLLDFTILLLNMVLISIAYEHTLYVEKDLEGPDPLLPPLSTRIFPHTDLPDKNSPLALDLRLGQIISRLRDPPPPPAPLRELPMRDYLPMPNTTSPWRMPLPPAATPLNLIVGARARAAQRARDRARAPRAVVADNNNLERERGRSGRELEEETGELNAGLGRRTIPGALDSEEVT
ncbi:hypothetical protein BDY19DRAFT_921875 [Irpex rosettiformis]|uniref:Uncharacterized protein n=1 Tax=Irpex rosettiformis TaxID=378272 RepID=A0ACB8UFF2_9APHY|nr:hypothetical protein BDY19DRAFT_921875 [Irpex rosettiformis]